MKSLLNFRGPLEMIILDWAGTTMDYGCMAPAVVFQKVFEEKDVPISLEEARVPMGAHKKVHIQRLTELESVRERWNDVHGRYPNSGDVDEMFASFVPSQEACLADYAELIPGCLEALRSFKEDYELKIGSTTGYLKNMTAILLEEAEKRGYVPDSTVCAEEVIEGRPAPWMCIGNALELNVWPPTACVKVDDTVPGVLEGVNACMWTIGLAKTGNEIGYPLDVVESMDPKELQERLDGAYERMIDAGANYVVDGIADVPDCLKDINERLAKGELPY